MKKVFLFEHICGGGMGEEAIPPALAAQGASMLETLVADCLAAGIEVLTTLDARGPARCAGATVTRIGSDRAVYARFDALAREADACLVIAPETDGVLAAWNERLASLGVPSMGCAPASIRLCGDKRMLSRHFDRYGVPSPNLIDHGGPDDADFPVVVKPVDGAGCEETFVCRDRGEMRRWDAMPRPNSLVQHCCHWPHGISVGVCVAMLGGGVAPLVCRRQRIGVHGDGPLQLRYEGGIAMSDRRLVRRAELLAARAVASVSGLWGIVGVDVMLDPDGADDAVIEINPRMTLSIVDIAPSVRRGCVADWLSACCNDARAPRRTAGA